MENGLRYAWEGSVRNEELQNYYEFEKRVSGVEGGSVAAVGCKSRDGPSVRVLNQCNGEKTTTVEEISVVDALLGLIICVLELYKGGAYHNYLIQYAVALVLVAIPVGWLTCNGCPPKHGYSNMECGKDNNGGGNWFC
ncbi:hypothetical protein C5167_016666 [Papaver somniferum]|nr:hypothetical protein C5167_016666 [Papaver somniferum]